MEKIINLENHENRWDQGNWSKQDLIDFHKFIHSKGLKVCVWTINDEKTFKYLIDLGVDGIITDKPKLLFEVLDSATNQ